MRAFEVSRHLLKHANQDAMALIVTGESVFTNQNRIIPNISITGDGAAAALVTLNGHGHKLISSSTLTLGKYAEGMWMDHTTLAEFGQLFESTMLKVAVKTLEKANLRWQDIALILPHNVNVSCWKGFAHYAKLPIEKIYLENIAETSHCFNADLLVNCDSALKKQRLKKGDYYMMATVAVGAVFGVNVFQV